MKQKILILTLLVGVFAATNVMAKYTFSYIGTDITGFGGYDEYVDKYLSSVNTTLGSFADAFVSANVSQPVFGEPYRNLALGGALSFAIAGLPEDGDPGSVTLEDTAIGISAGAFATLSLDPLDGIFGLGLFANSDFTVKFMKTPKIEGDKTDAEFWNLGLILRKRLVSKARIIPLVLSFEGIGISLGYFMQKNKINQVLDIGATEIVDITGGTATLTADTGILDLEIETKTLDAEMKFYFNILGFLDLFFGAGMSYNLQTDVSALMSVDSDVSFNTGGPIESASGGTLLISGTGTGKKWLPRAVAGVQLNILMIKIPAQVAITKNEDKYGVAVTTGVTLSF